MFLHSQVCASIRSSIYDSPNLLLLLVKQVSGEWHMLPWLAIIVNPPFFLEQALIFFSSPAEVVQLKRQMHRPCVFFDRRKQCRYLNILTLICTSSC